MTENERKKDYLKQYIDNVRAAKRIEVQIEEVRRNKMLPSFSIDGMPHGNVKKDLSDYAAAIDELENKLITTRYRKIKIYTDIFYRIERLEKENEKEILTKRYINGYKWERIAYEMGYGYRQILRMHGMALSRFDLKDVI